MRRIFPLAVVILLFLFSCKPSRPHGIIKPSKMEAILYDYYIASSVPTREYAANIGHEAFHQTVLQHHGVTSEQFDESMAYYVRHADQLRDIYKNVEKRMSKDYMAMGGSVTDFDDIGTQSLSGDTAEIWNLSHAKILLPRRPYNVVQFDIPIDTAFHAGDQILLSFDAQYHFSDNHKEASAVLMLKLGNDSIMSANCQIISPNHYALRLQDYRDLGIKAVRGFIILNDKSELYTTPASMTRLLILRNIHLFRMHKKQMPQVDTLSSVQPDTLIKQDRPLPEPTQDLVQPNQTRKISEKGGSTAPLPLPEKKKELPSTFSPKDPPAAALNKSRAVKETYSANRRVPSSKAMGKAQQRRQQRADSIRQQRSRNMR